MRWHKDLYAGASVVPKLNKVKWKIKHNAGQLHVYVITLASNPENLLDIIPSWELLQKRYPKKDMYIIGLAGNYEEALLLAGQIVQEVFVHTKGFDVRSYIQKRGNKN